MQAVDGGGRRSQNSAEITINVLRNQFPPFWITSTSGSYPYSTTLGYRTQQSSRVFTVSAIDNRDPFNVTRYELSTNELNARYFRIDSVSGVITLTGDLTDAEVSNRLRFNVRIFL